VTTVTRYREDDEGRPFVDGDVVGENGAIVIFWISIGSTVVAGGGLVNGISGGASAVIKDGSKSGGLCWCAAVDQELMLLFSLEGVVAFSGDVNSNEDGLSGCGVEGRGVEDPCGASISGVIDVGGLGLWWEFGLYRQHLLRQERWIVRCWQ
jgi:hypothetical protein